VFYFAPQRRWYLIFQGGDPLYSTTTDINDPKSWSKPQSFFAAPPEILRTPTGGGSWLDFWIICNKATCYLFNTGDNGRLYRSETSVEHFPNGFHNTTVVLQSANPAELFEASMTYKVAGAKAYITLVEAIGPQGRYFRAWTSDRLDGAWRPLADSPERPFAGAANVSFPGPIWSQGVSHGELVRAGIDQTLKIDPCKPLQFLYQGLAPGADPGNYLLLPYRLGLLTAQGANPVSRFCRRH
jgi:endo-1,4-beta-xylanase